MKFSICVVAHPLDSAHRTAIRFCNALIAKNHQIEQIFFYQDAVILASNLLVPAQDEYPTQQNWLDFSNQNQIELNVCVSAAIKRGVLNDADCARYNKNQSNVHSCFNIVGLGEFLTSMDNADKQVTFG
ncbi:sulfurtransferase complex subunit TusD [Marinicellulosiphila megalodicopiae]|uniref:sulfurtransferase complex subunit TusD n=1 Tax=Marinicellulosiphila megalodicopiae TaxID=2724896 RepID=UPI003BAE7185